MLLKFSLHRLQKMFKILNKYNFIKMESFNYLDIILIDR